MTQPAATFCASAICPMCSKFVPNLDSDKSVAFFIATDVDFRQTALGCAAHEGECERRLVDLVKGKMPFCDLFKVSETILPSWEKKVVRLLEGRSRRPDTGEGWKAKYQ